MLPPEARLHAVAGAAGEAGGISNGNVGVLYVAPSTAAGEAWFDDVAFGTSPLPCPLTPQDASGRARIDPEVLGLDDPRWNELDHAYGPAGDIPDLLRALERGDQELWDELVPALCHQGCVYTATYAAVPHIVRIGSHEPLDDQVAFWSFIGAVVSARETAPVPGYLHAAWAGSLVHAEEMTLACFAPGLDDATGLELLIALAGIRRLPAVAETLRLLRTETASTTCPRCGTTMRVSTADVPFVVEEDELTLALGTSGEMKAPRAPHPEVRQLAQVARIAGLVDLEHRVAALAKETRCPTCQLEFSLIDRR